MTFPAITADGQTHTSGGVSYTSVLAQNRWRRSTLTLAPSVGSITREMIGAASVTPDRIWLSCAPRTTPPASPAVGEIYRITPTATGAWAGREHQLARFNGTDWEFIPPYEGMLIWDPDTNQLMAWESSTGWIVVGPDTNTINNARLPSRISEYSGVTIDWNTVYANGFYKSAAGAYNSPEGAIPAVGYYHGMMYAYDANTAVQRVVQIDNDNTPTSTLNWERTKSSNVWGPWYRTAFSINELDTRYLSYVAAADPAAFKFKVMSRNVSVPPATPATGDTYIVGTSATGAWAGRDGQIARWTGSAWTFTAPQSGHLFWIADESRLYGHSGSTMTLIGPPAATGSDAYQYRYKLVDSTGAVFGPTASTIDYVGQSWTVVFPTANLGSGTTYSGFGTVTTAGTVTNLIGPEATAVRVSGQNYWYYAASYSATVGPPNPVYNDSGSP